MHSSGSERASKQESVDTFNVTNCLHMALYPHDGNLVLYLAGRLTHTNLRTDLEQSFREDIFVEYTFHDGLARKDEDSHLNTHSLSTL